MSNIYRFEFKRNITQTLIWLLIAVGFMFLYGSFFSYFAESADSLFQNVPEAFSDLVGLNPDTVTTYDGFYSFILTFVLIITALFFSVLGHRLFNYETTEKVNEYLFVKPIKRSNLFLTKALVGLTMFIIYMILYFALSIFAAELNANGDYDFGNIFELNTTVVLIGLFFFSASTFISVFNIKIRSSAFIAMPLVLIFFFLSFFSAFLDIDWLVYTTPFALLNAQTILDNGLEIGKIIYLVVVILILMVGSFTVFTRKEVE